VALPARGVLQIRSSDAEHVIAVYHPLVVAKFTRPPTDAELATLRSIADEGRAQGVSGGMLFVVARRNVSGGIDPRVRSFFEKMVRDNSAQVGASAVVILMQGFGASLMRSFVSGLLLLAGKRRMIQLFASVEPACDWLAPLHGLTAATLLQAYAQATATLP
jgi:hypothetical protein